MSLFLFVLFSVGMFSLGYAAHAINNINYRKRWMGAVNLLNSGEEAGFLAPESKEAYDTSINGWTIKTGIAKGHYTKNPNLKFDFVTLELVREKERITIRPTSNQLGLDPGDYDFAAKMANYRKKAEAAARSLP